MAPRSPQTVESCRALIAWMLPVIEAFPRARRFTFDDRLVTALLDVPVEATYTKRPPRPSARQQALGDGATFVAHGRLGFEDGGYPPPTPCSRGDGGIGHVGDWQRSAVSVEWASMRRRPDRPGRPRVHRACLG